MMNRLTGCEIFARVRYARRTRAAGLLGAHIRAADPMDFVNARIYCF